MNQSGIVTVGLCLKLAIYDELSGKYRYFDLPEDFRQLEKTEQSAGVLRSIKNSLDEEVKK